jgi:CRP/FNR family transcriptional regulator, cyclic AMP receptor protein
VVTKHVLKEFKIFKGLDDSELEKIAGLCHERTLKKGALLFTQGTKSTKLHLCRTGGADITIQLFEPHGIEVTVHQLKAGEVYGWASLVKPNLFTASAKCIEKTEEIYIKAVDLRKLFNENNHVGYVIMKNLAEVVSSRLTEHMKKLAVEIATDIRKEW